MASPRMDSEQRVWTGCAGGYDTGWYSYSYHDNDSHSLIRFCITNTSDTWYCGWGDTAIGTFTHELYGVITDSDARSTSICST